MYNNIKSKMGAQIFAVEHYKFVYSPGRRLGLHY